MMKKDLSFVFVLALIWVFVSLMLIPEVSAAAYFGGAGDLVGRIVDALVEIFEPVLKPILGNGNWDGLYLFEKLLLLVMLVSIVYLVIGKMPFLEKTKGSRWIIAIVIPLIGVRFVDSNWLESIFLQYQLLAIFITAIIPFVIFFFFVYNVAEDFPFLRKIFWILFIIIYFGLWSTVQEDKQNVIFFWTGIAGIAGLFWDRQIYRYYRLQKIKASDKTALRGHIADVNSEIQDLETKAMHASAAGRTEDAQFYRDRIKDLTEYKKTALTHE